MTTKYTKEEVAAHNKMGDCWITMNGKVYDVSKYMEDHPGTPEIMIENANGEDASEEYELADHSKRAK